MTEIKTVQNFYMTTNSLSLYMTATGRELPLCPPSLSLALLDVFILRPMPTRQHMHAARATYIHACTHAQPPTKPTRHSQPPYNKTRATIHRQQSQEHPCFNIIKPILCKVEHRCCCTPAARHITGVQLANVTT